MVGVWGGLYKRNALSWWKNGISLRIKFGHNEGHLVDATISHSTRRVGDASTTPIWCRAPGLVPIVALAQQCGLAALADEHLSVPTDKGANAGAKVSSLVAGMVAGADSIDDMALLRHGAMGTLFDRPYAPSTLGSFLREFTFGHVRQLDAVASRLLSGLARSDPAAGRDRRPRPGRHRRHHHRSPRLRQTRIGIRLLRGARVERVDHHGHHRTTPHR